ncbi:MAG: hypothetical protein IKC69_05840 [Clostridia bacterium]|nr:hypothetical protein [Clostridia bacterium]
MYSGTLNRAPFHPDPSVMQHADERERYNRLLRESGGRESPPPKAAKPKESLAGLLEMLSPEDSALIALILFLLCDNTNNDVVLLGILLYVLLSK